MRHDSASARLSTSWTTRRQYALSTSTWQAMINLRRGRIPLPRSRRPSVLRRWSRRYLILVASADALVGGISAAIPASISNTLSGQPHVVPLLCLVGLVVWPAAIAMCRGYRRNRIGIGLDEPGAVIRAGMVVVVAGALPAGIHGG